MNEGKRSLKKVLVYTLVVSICSSGYYGFQTTQNFLTGSGQQIFFDTGMLLGGIIFPWLLSLPVVLAIYLYKFFQKKELSFLRSWTYIAAGVASILLILYFQAFSI